MNVTLAMTLAALIPVSASAQIARPHVSARHLSPLQNHGQSDNGRSNAVRRLINAAGWARLTQLNSPTLRRLTAPDASGRLPIMLETEAIDLLARQLEAAGHDEADLADLGSDENIGAKLAALDGAARELEEQAAAAADLADAAVEKPIRLGTHENVARKIAAAEELAAFLEPARAGKIMDGRRLVLEFDQQLEARVHAFKKDLPRQLAGQFVDDPMQTSYPFGAGLISRDEDGYFANDGPPDQRHAQVSELIDARIERLERSPIGPWTIAEARALERAVLRPEIAAALNQEGGQQRNVDGNPDSVALRYYFSNLKGRARGWEGSQPGLAQALDRFKHAQPLRRKDIKAIETFYNESAAWRVRPRKDDGDTTPSQTDPEWTGKARMIAALYHGGAGVGTTFPSIEELEISKRLLYDRYKRRERRAKWVISGNVVVAMLGALAIYIGELILPMWLLGLPVAVAITAFILMLWFGGQSDAIEHLYTGYAAELVKRYFDP